MPCVYLGNSARYVVCTSQESKVNDSAIHKQKWDSAATVHIEGHLQLIHKTIFSLGSFIIQSIEKGYCRCSGTKKHNILLFVLRNKPFFISVKEPPGNYFVKKNSWQYGSDPPPKVAGFAHRVKKVQLNTFPFIWFLHAAKCAKSVNWTQGWMFKPEISSKCNAVSYRTILDAMNLLCTVYRRWRMNFETVDDQIPLEVMFF